MKTEIERLREALEDIAHNTSTSIPLGLSACEFYESQLRRAIGIAARALHTERN
jgi:hypothetical protein